MLEQACLQFVVDTYDPETECIVNQIGIETKDVHELSEVLGISDMQAHETYELDANDLKRINDHYGTAIDLSVIKAILRYRLSFDDLPYQIHTNRELALMLARKKPLAVFVGVYFTTLEFEQIPEEGVFHPYVASGRFVKREYIEIVGREGASKTRRILYARPSESWRIDSYILLMQTARKVGWNEGFERIEGALLGYEEWQLDAHISSRNSRDQD